VFHVYKNRRSKYKGVKLWSIADLGTCRITDLFVTNSKYELIPMKSTVITIENEQKKRQQGTEDVPSETF